MSDSKRSANEELRHALRMCMEQMCARCREAADALTASIPCLTGCETLKIAKAALDRKPMNCERFSDLNAAQRYYIEHGCPKGLGMIVDGEIRKTPWKSQFEKWLFDKQEGATK